MLPFAIAAFLFSAATSGAYAISAVRKAATRVRRRRRASRAEIERAKAVLDSREAALDETARAYADAQTEERLKDVPLDTLREQSSRRIKVAPLEDAGYLSVADLIGKSRQELRSVKGIGPVSAQTIEKAVRAYVKTAKALAPPMPTPELEEPRAVDLARDALVYLEAWREIGDAPDRMRAAVRDTEERAADALKDAAYPRWMLGLIQKGRNGAREDTLAALETEFEAALTSDDFTDATAAIERLAQSRTSHLGPDEIKGEFQRQYADACSLLERVFGELEPDVVEKRRRKSVHGAALADAEIAARVEAFPLDTTGLSVILRRYQVFGAQYMLAMERTVIGDEMGLGKTIQALAAMVHLKNKREYSAALVVAPASILANWLHEIKQRTSLLGHLLHGDDFDEALAAWTRDGGIAVTSYSTLRRNQTEVFRDGPPEIAMLIADEAHYVKNPEAGRTKALVRMSDKADHVSFLSGTPLENHPEEFVHLLESLAPARARDLGEFLDAPGAVLGGARRFHEEVTDVYLRRNQEDVLKELPPRIEKEEWVHLNLPEFAEYEAQVHASNFMGMRRAVTVSPADEPSAKFERVEDLLEEYRESGVRVLLFSYFLDVLAEAQRRFENVGAITGRVSPQDRFDLIQRFGAVDGHALLVGQIEAAGTGLNLQAAGAVILMEPQLKPTTEAQAIARAHRMGQTRRVVVHRILAHHTVDERLVEMLAQKQELFERFARDSLIKEASEEATATSPASAIIAAEQARLLR